MTTMSGRIPKDTQIYRSPEAAGEYLGVFEDNWHPTLMELEVPINDHHGSCLDIVRVSTTAHTVQAIIRAGKDESPYDVVAVARLYDYSDWEGGHVVVSITTEESLGQGVYFGLLGGGA